ncbi:transposase [Parafrankia soli]|uniref:transposase n=1 Tax=Parafrankia soli TaxID=2599596 RepID=UPI003B5870D3
MKHLAVLSTGEQVDNPKPLTRSLRRLRPASRAYARSKPGGAGRRQHAAALARLHAHVANQRRDGLHKLTTRLTRTTTCERQGGMTRRYQALTCNGAVSPRTN